MSYADATYYKDIYLGTLIPDDHRDKALKDASRDIDSLTYNRITSAGFNNLTDFQKNIIKEVTCLHADFIHQYGDFLDSPISGYGAGSTSVSLKASSVAGQNGISTSKQVYAMLRQTGLMTRLIL